MTHVRAATPTSKSFSLEGWCWWSWFLSVGEVAPHFLVRYLRPIDSLASEVVLHKVSEFLLGMCKRICQVVLAAAAASLITKAAPRMDQCMTSGAQ